MNTKWLETDVAIGPTPAPREYSDVSGIWVSDLHFSHNPPVSRSTEKDWYKAQDRNLSQLWDLQGVHNASIFCCGDIFHKALSPNELVNFLLSRLPTMYAIAGNHDLPYHSYEDIRKSAFWTLVEAGRVKLIEPNMPMSVGSLLIQGFPYGYDIVPAEKSNGLMLNVAMVHAYCWKEGKGYYKASESSHVDRLKKKLKGYDVVFFGDNHQAFRKKYEDVTIINIGGFQRRHSDEYDHEPSAWLLKTSGKVVRHRFDVSKDVFADCDAEKLETALNGMKEFISELEETQGARFDFSEAVKQYITIEGIKGKLKRELLEAIDDARC